MNIKLMPWSLEYAESIACHANNKNIANNLRNTFPSPYTYEDAVNFIKTMINDEISYSRAIVVNNEAVGSIGIHFQNDVYSKSAELGYWLSEEYWNKGIITESIKEITSDGFSKFDIVRIYAEPFACNESSKRVLEKVGFNLEGIKRKSVFKNGKYYDSYLFSLIKNP